MIVEVSQISEPEFSFDFTAQPDLQDETARLTEPVKISGKLRKGIVQVDAEGSVKGNIEMECTRCLQMIKAPLDVPFKAVFVAEEFDNAEKESELRPDQLDVSVFDGEKIDLTDLAREQILLSLPARFLCRKDCKGLCEKCGANKNSAGCDCKEKEIDPRWSALKKLK